MGCRVADDVHAVVIFWGHKINQRVRRQRRCHVFHLAIDLRSQGGAGKSCANALGNIVQGRADRIGAFGTIRKGDFDGRDV